MPGEITQWLPMVAASFVALPCALVIGLLLLRDRTRRGVAAPVARRQVFAEVAIVAGTVPWVWITLTPLRSATEVRLRPLVDLVNVLDRGFWFAFFQIVGNMLVFAAFGFFAPIRWPLGLTAIAIVATAMAIAVETLQFALHLGRVASVDDVLLNALGRRSPRPPRADSGQRRAPSARYRDRAVLTPGGDNVVSHAFQVDLRGVVDLLSHHLYGSPRVYVRELLQNAIDAITARRAVDPDTPARVWFEPPELTGDGTLRVHDTGIGLTEAQVHELLATIGRSSKRDELGFARQEFLGQFGIGLLSCFLVADEIVVMTRAQDAPTVRWVGYADGRYEVSLPAEQRPEQGTTVALTPRPETDHWLTARTVTDLARLYGSLLPATVHVGDIETTTGPPPWQRDDRRAALREFAHEHVGVEPFDVVDVAVPEAGLTGVAYILPIPVSPAARAGHRVYLKRMLLAESAEGLLPDWAFFARCVVDATELRPTASREALYEDGLLESVRESLGDQLRDWLVQLSATDPRRLGEFLAIHRLGVRAFALHDDEMLRVVERWLPVETNMGQMTLRDFRERFGVLRYSPTVDQFRQLSAIAAAQNIPLINGGYVYEADIIERLSLVDNSIVIERLDPSDLATRFDALPRDVELALRPFLGAAQAALDSLDCEVVVRAFEPSGMPALYLLDRDAAFRGELRATKEKTDPMWADVLSALDATARDSRPQLVLNHRNPLVRRLTALRDPRLVGTSVEALYGQALLMGYHPMRPADAALLNRSFLALLDRAVPGEPA